MTVIARGLSGEEDYLIVRSLLIDVAADRTQALYCTIGDLDWWRSTEEDPENIWSMQISLEAERAVAFSWPDKKPMADILVHPEYSELLPGLLAWTEDQTLEACNGQPVSLEISSFSKDTNRNEVLRGRGYVQGEPAYRNFAYDFAGFEAAPPLPAGYAFRDMRNPTGDEIERRVEVHQAAFGQSEMSLAKHLRVIASPTYRPELDLVITAEDGSFASFTIVWFDEVNQTGLFEPIGTHPNHLRRGLGRAIMTEGLRRLSELGATRALVSTGPDNVEANGLYTSLGFQAVDENMKWTKKLR